MKILMLKDGKVVDMKKKNRTPITVERAIAEGSQKKDSKPVKDLQKSASRIPEAQTFSSKAIELHTKMLHTKKSSAEYTPVAHS